MPAAAAAVAAAGRHGRAAAAAGLSKTSGVSPFPMVEAFCLMEHARATGAPVGDLVEQRLQGKPLQLVVGTQPFADLDVACLAGQCIPRPETEQWCAWLAARLTTWTSPPAISVLEVGSGTGCVSLALARALPTTRVVGIDTSPAAVQQSRLNAAGQRNVVFERVTVDADGSWVPRALALNDGARYDVIVSNPPYVPEHMWRRVDRSVRRWESPAVLYGGHLGLDVARHVIAAAPDLLRPSAASSSSSSPSIVVECGYEFQTVALKRWMRSVGLDDVEHHYDYAGRPRWVSAVQPPFVVDAPG
ncbi:unnamed protein product (mitochondrion) [Plasmodiophora brassicae]|uniref:Methyltransferase type 12 domain-containing protein n=1 Tax=Plasmodiophora brassicae TaxID=37360 RepID=A0A3P3YJ75_PLABS|nr:unnamed protein product [Plasmodiophora brassicae]